MSRTYTTLRKAYLNTSSPLINHCVLEPAAADLQGFHLPLSLRERSRGTSLLLDLLGQNFPYA